MEPSRNRLILRRGIRLSTRIAKAKLGEPKARPLPPATKSRRLTEFNGFGDNPGR
jgi:hypothetical protein